MRSLTSSQQSFVELMKQGEEYEWRGFELLLQRPDFGCFFDALAGEGLFDPARNPGPVEAEKPGYYRVPYWQPLTYLEAAAKFAGERADMALAEKLMGVLRSVTYWRDDDDKPRDNHNTWFVFAKILGLLPTGAVSLADLQMLPTWLTGRFDRFMAGHTLAGGAMRKFLASDAPDDLAKACRVLYHCTALEYPDGNADGSSVSPEARTVVEDYWFKRLINPSAAEFGRKAGRAAADVFLARLGHIFAHALGGKDTWLLRPAIEEHPQNYDWRAVYNRFVEGFRDTMLGRIESDAATARPYVEELFASGSQIVERVAIHLVDQRFEALRSFVPKAIYPAFFDSGHRHELHLFLENHFQGLSEHEKNGILDAIRALLPPECGEDSERRRLRIQQNWLLPIASQGYQPAETWLAEVNGALGAAQPPPHPDFNSYHETRWGFGPTPHTVQDLVAFARSGTIVERLNDFKPSGSWDGPSKRSLSDAVIDAVGTAPLEFIGLLSQFLNTKREYQYAVIAGFQKSCGARGTVNKKGSLGGRSGQN
jgi:hypothetical protein